MVKYSIVNHKHLFQNSMNQIYTKSITQSRREEILCAVNLLRNVNCEDVRSIFFPSLSGGDGGMYHLLNRTSRLTLNNGKKNVCVYVNE